MNYVVHMDGRAIYITDHHPDSLESIPLDINEAEQAQLKSLISKPTESTDDTITWITFTKLWNEAADRNKGWRKILPGNKDILTRFNTAKKNFPLIEQWRLIITGMEADDFFSGRRGYDRPKPLTLFMKNRYFDFYETGLEAKDKPREQTVDDILNEIKGLMV